MPVQNVLWGQNGACGGNVEIIVINEIYKTSIIEYFVSGGQITESPTVIVGQVVTEMTEYLLFSGGLDSDHYDLLLLVKDEEKLGIFDKVSFCRQSLLKIISLNSSTI